MIVPVQSPRGGGAPSVPFTANVFSISHVGSRFYAGTDGSGVAPWDTCLIYADDTGTLTPSSWSALSPGFTPDGIIGVNRVAQDAATGNYVAIASGALSPQIGGAFVAYSADGLMGWSAGSGMTLTFVGEMASNGVDTLVIVGQDGFLPAVAYSTDGGVNWTTITDSGSGDFGGAGEYFSRVIWHSALGLFIADGNMSFSYTSAAGLASWTAHVRNLSGITMSLCQGSGNQVVAGTDDNLTHSTTNYTAGGGPTWSNSSALNQTPWSLAYRSGITTFALAGPDGMALAGAELGTNGTTWSDAAVPLTDLWSSVGEDSAVFVYGGPAILAYSTDGSTLVDVTPT